MSIFRRRYTTNPVLDQLCHKETCAEIIEAMSGQQLFLAWLRWNGNEASEVADMLGVSSQGVREHLNDAKRRVCHEVPEAKAAVGEVGPPRQCVRCGAYIGRGVDLCQSCAAQLRGVGSMGFQLPCVSDENMV